WRAGLRRGFGWRDEATLRTVRTSLPPGMKFMQRLALVALLTVVPALRAWDYEGHRIVNQLALAALPQDFPEFVHEPEQAERIAFLAGEPDRWRNNSDLPIKQYNVLDHYLDIEQLEWAGLDAM